MMETIFAASEMIFSMALIILKIIIIWYKNLKRLQMLNYMGKFLKKKINEILTAVIFGWFKYFVFVLYSFIVYNFSNHTIVKVYFKFMNQ